MEVSFCVICHKLCCQRWPEVIVRALREEGFEVAFNVEGYRDEGDALEEGEDESEVEVKIKSKQDGR